MIIEEIHRTGIDVVHGTHHLRTGVQAGITADLLQCVHDIDPGCLLWILLITDTADDGPYYAHRVTFVGMGHRLCDRSAMSMSHHDHQSATNMVGRIIYAVQDTVVHCVACRSYHEQIAQTGREYRFWDHTGIGTCDNDGVWVLPVLSCLSAPFDRHVASAGTGNEFGIASPEPLQRLFRRYPFPVHDIGW